MPEISTQLQEFIEEINNTPPDSVYLSELKKKAFALAVQEHPCEFQVGDIVSAMVQVDQDTADYVPYHIDRGSHIGRYPFQIDNIWPTIGPEGEIIYAYYLSSEDGDINGQLDNFIYPIEKDPIEGEWSYEYHVDCPACTEGFDALALLEYIESYSTHDVQCPECKYDFKVNIVK